LQNFFSNGKLLLTGEYLVLDGALALAVPTKFGQSLSVEPIDEPKLIWKSISNKGLTWYEDVFTMEAIASGNFTPRNERSEVLVQILNSAKQLNPDFLNSKGGYKVSTKLDFPEFWGLGSSSTLINNMAQWAHVDAYQLLDRTFGGSGYDIACANHNSPITYQLQNGNRTINPVKFYPQFKDSLYFVYLNKKQDSREGISQYKANINNAGLAISEIGDITSQIIHSKTLREFESLIDSHEKIISKIIKLKPIKEVLFRNYEGAVKSLGAWGGDFTLVTGDENSMEYFRHKGYRTIISFNDMILK